MVERKKPLGNTMILIYEHAADLTLVGVFTQMGAECFVAANTWRKLTCIRHRVNEEDDGEVIDVFVKTPASLYR